jgi:hypothetical protein
VVQTELSLEVSNGSNIRVMRLFDTSHYYDEDTVENYIIDVLPVNKDRWVSFNVQKGFSLILNSSNLRYNRAKDEDELADLPDGIYEIKQSIKPNIHTLNHFYHFRITEALNKLGKSRSELLSDKCSISRTEYLQNRDKLRDIEEYLWAAKWLVEEDHDKAKGKELYDFATKLLEHYSNECQC